MTVAVDQLFGYAMDPTTEWATPEASGLFAVLTVITLIPLLLHLRCVDRDEGPSAPPAGADARSVLGGRVPRSPARVQAPPASR